MKKLVSQNLTRRRLLQTTALGAGLALPLASTNALSLTPRKRVIFVYTPMGAPYGLWLPDGCGHSMVLKRASAPLEPVKHHCLFLNNLNMPDGGLGLVRKVLGGGFTEARATTLDIRLGEALSDNVQMANLHLGTHHTPEVTSAKNYNLIPFATSAASVYEALFSKPGAEADTPIDKRFRAELALPVAKDFDKEVELQIELSALALSRNVTNVITLMWGDLEGDFLLPDSFLPDSLQKFKGLNFHGAVHSGSRELYIFFRAYLALKLTYLIQLLEAMRDDSGRSLLESTLIVHVADQGNGEDHTGNSAPYFIAGGKNLFRNGAVLNANATQYDLMDTIAAAYGLTSAKYGTRIIEGLKRT